MKSAKNNEKEILLYLYTSIFKNRGGQKEPQSILLSHGSIARHIRGFPVSPPSFPSNSYFPLPSSLFPKSNSKGQLEKEGKEKFNYHRLTSENAVYLEFTKLPPPSQKGKRKEKFIHHW